MTDNAGPETRRFPAWLQKVLALAVLVVCCAVAWWLGASWSANPASRSGLMVADEHLNMGDVWEDSAFRWELPIQNTTEQDIEIVGFASSCACSSIEPPALTVPAGATAKVAITFNLTGKVKDEVTEGTEFVEQIVPRLKGRAVSQPVWTIEGRIRRLLKVDPPRLYLEIAAGEKQAQPARVKITSAVQLSEIRATSNKPVASPKVTVQRPSARDFELEIHMDPSAAPGIHTFEVSLDAVAAGKPMSATRIFGVARVAADIAATPASITFGAVPLGDTCRDWVVLQSSTGREFEVMRVETSAPGLSVEPLKRIDRRNQRCFSVSQEITKSHDQRNLVRFVVRMTDGSALTIPVEIFYYGLDGEKRPPGK